MKKLRKFFDREENLLIHIIATILVIILGFVFKISNNQWVLVCVMCVFVISTELINSAIEITVDLITLNYHPLAKIAKDTSAAAVVVAAFCALIVGIYVFIPKIIVFLK